MDICLFLHTWLQARGPHGASGGNRATRSTAPAMDGGSRGLPAADSSMAIDSRVISGSNAQNSGSSSRVAPAASRSLAAGCTAGKSSDRDENGGRDANGDRGENGDRDEDCDRDKIVHLGASGGSAGAGAKRARVD